MRAMRDFGTGWLVCKVWSVMMYLGCVNGSKGMI